MTDISEKAARLRELLAKATPGPWYASDRFRARGGKWISRADDYHIGEVFYSEESAEECEANASLIVEAINALPALLDHIESTKPIDEARAALEKLVRRTPFEPAEGGIKVFLSFEQMREHQAILRTPRES